MAGPQKHPSDADHVLNDSPDADDSSATRHLDPALRALLDRYEEARESGEHIDIDDLCRELPGREDEVRSVLLAVKTGEEMVKAVWPTPRRKSPSETDPLVGGTLTSAARFSRLRHHARGGLGCVLKAFDDDLGRDVAVKVIADNRQHDPECRERFLRESEVTGRLRHPGIVPVFGRGETIDKRPFYVMPFLEEGSLEKAINAFHEDRPNYRPNDPQFRDLLSRFIAACKTVAYAHSRGVVHRDLKPHNIMLGRYGETLVIDWGLAERSRRESHHRLTGERSIEVRGASGHSSSSGGFTPQYASPEQFDGTVEVGPPSDVYSLGAMLYKLVSGVPPLTATTLGEMRKAGLNGDFPPPKERKHCVPKPLQAICLKALRTDPQQRYQSPEALAADVEAYLADAPVAAHPEDLLGRSARLVRREWPAVLSVMGALLLITLLSFFVAITQQGLKTDARLSSMSRLQLAATLAAQAGGGEIDRRWRLLESEAASLAVIESVQALNADSGDTEARERLQAHLTERYVYVRDVQGVKFLSMFVNSVQGEQLARVPKSESIGMNFAYRDYFHGRHVDLPKDTLLPAARQVVLSVVFISTNTGDPTVAVSVPIRGKNSEGQDGQVIGRLCMAITVGDLGMFDQLGDEEVPMLVETRKYDWDGKPSYGVVVHHPDFRTSDADDGNTSTSPPRVDDDIVDALVEKWNRNKRAEGQGSALVISEFIDPIGEESTEAAFASVVIPWRENDVKETGWFIVLHPRQSVDD